MMMTNPTLPKGITRIPAKPAAPAAPPAKADVDANVKTAAQMHTSLGQKIEDAAAWLIRTLPGVFTSLAQAIAAIKKVI
jgi:hypothetical protein